MTCFGERSRSPTFLRDNFCLRRSDFSDKEKFLELLPANPTTYRAIHREQDIEFPKQGTN
ncbi:hypothetical protein LEP1GSC193_1988 [Leptospira alstonii serovar Pingchang str. 80-412]|uniref:Uncharacterized protein n=2 Tax=Leptospira alstonii TaxID=28452 RepID=M6CSZ5_9LEPT|nr:hypothetical protein LEP1GSC194_1705 [Leptospira alstonii serovar Sichuan str. 79601]EQA81542.1 hypothetical protein LEP1GSC193_1988 [Leptospira alstonii serovar Pingchang str. 80-412]